jgi:DNA-binding CsgD family transcriptional regulator
VTAFTLHGDDYALFSFPLTVPNVPSELSAAERQVALDLVKGTRPAAIARVRGRSLATVRNQIRSIYAKVGVQSVAELCARCARRTFEP